MNYFVDTNIFLRFLIEDDKKMHNECVQFLEWVNKKHIKIYISKIVLAEIFWTLNSFYSQPKETIVKSLKAILNIKSLKLIEDFNPLLAIEIFSDNSVKFVDSLIASSILKQKNNWTIVSYDKDFDKIGLKRKEPNKII